MTWITSADEGNPVSAHIAQRPFSHQPPPWPHLPNSILGSTMSGSFYVSYHINNSIIVLFENKCSEERRLDEMIESPFFLPLSWWRCTCGWGERGGNPGTVLDELAAEGGRETGSVWIRAQTSRPPRGEGRVRRTFKTLHVWEPSI